MHINKTNFSLTILNIYHSHLDEFQRLVLEFDRLQINSEASTTTGDVWTRNEQMNNNFIALRDEWVSLPNEMQALHSGNYIQAQANFHIIGQNWVRQLSPNEDSAVDHQPLQFGDLPPELEALPSADNSSVTFTTTTATIGQSDQSVVQPSTTIANSGTGPIVSTSAVGIGSMDVDQATNNNAQ